VGSKHNEVSLSNIIRHFFGQRARGGRVTKQQNIVIVWRSRRKTYTNYVYRVKGLEVNTRSSDLAARLIIKYEDDNPLHVETQKDFDVVSNRHTDAFCQGIS
jgi:hypothetical protein